MPILKNVGISRSPISIELYKHRNETMSTLILPQAIGSERAPTMGDRGKMIYTEATLLEVQRIATIGETAYRWGPCSVSVLQWRHNERDGVSNYQARDFYSTVYSGTDERKHQSSVSLTFVRGIHRWLVNSPHKWPITRKMFPFDDVFMY